MRVVRIERARASRPNLEARRVVSHCTRCLAPVPWYVCGRDAALAHVAREQARRATLRERRWCGECRADDWNTRRFTLRRLEMPWPETQTRGIQ